jgi:hypothetical protein
MKSNTIFLLVVSLSGCFEPPGSTCSDDSNCPANQHCVALETRSVCLNTDAADTGPNHVRDAALPPSDAGASPGADAGLFDAGLVDGGEPSGDAGVTLPDAGPEPQPSGIVAAVGAHHSCAVADDQLRCWGANTHYQLGLSDTESGDRFVPVVASGTGAAAPDHLAAGEAFTCANYQGQVRCWGRNPFTGTVPEPARPWSVPVPENSGVLEMAAGRSHYCLLFSDGRVACSGSNDSGQLGRAAEPPNDGSLQVVDGVSEVTKIALGGDQSCALLRSGQVTCWGARPDHNPAQGDAPVEARILEGLGEVISLSVGAQHLCAIDTSYTARCLGDNTHRQIDLSNITRRSITTLEPLGIGLEYRAIHASLYGTCAIDNSGHVYCWGMTDTQNYAAPTQVPSLESVVRLIPGSMAHHRCAQTEDESLHCWGVDTLGQLGRGVYEPGEFLAASQRVDLEPQGDGSNEEPATSCRQLHEQYPQYNSGSFIVRPPGAESNSQVYCDQGWSLILIVPGQGEPGVAAYTGTLWGDQHVDGPLPQDINADGAVYRSSVYSSLSYGFVRIGFWSDALERDRVVSFFDGPRVSMGALIGSGEHVPFGEAATSENGPVWCELFDVCGWGNSGELSLGYNATWSGRGVRIGLAARQDQPSCNAPVPTYMGVGGSDLTAGIWRSYSSVQNSNCSGNNHTRAINSKVWVR